MPASAQPSPQDGPAAETEIAVIGGGLVGMAIAYGLQARGRQVTVFDEGDRAFRASRGNFGLVWVQGKGVALPDYARWTRLSASLWPELAGELEEQGGAKLELAQPGGLDMLLSESEAEAAVARLEGLRAALGGDYPFEFLGHNQLKALEPAVGPKVTGAIFGPEDGHVNPLYLLRGLHQAFQRRGGRLANGRTVNRIEPLAEGFRIEHEKEWRAQKVVLCAGLGNAALAPQLGLEAPVRPNRGHVLITERMQPFLRHPGSQIRQVGEGAVQIGDSKEDAGFDDGTAPPVLAGIVRRAVRIYPRLEPVRIVRSWSALRVMSPDGHPIYDHSEQCPGAFLVTCHSGVTLAAAHARVLAGWILGEDPPDYMESFSVRRLARQTAA